MEHIVAPEEDGLRLREVLRRVMGVSYTAMKSAKWENRILLDGKPAPVDRFVHPGMVVRLLPGADHPAYSVRPYPLPLLVPFLDDALLIVDKPAPLASQSSVNHPDDSLENAVFSHLLCPDAFVYRPVNRLDKGTSGLMAVARTAHAQHRLQQQLHSPSFRRVYLAVTDGIPPESAGTVDQPIAKEPASTVRRIISPDGKPSVTHYEVLRTGGGRALVRLALETGRTHQIRVHMQSLGCPVFGDFLYGRESDELPGRFALHSAELSLVHPVTGQTLCFSSPLPPALAALIP